MNFFKILGISLKNDDKGGKGSIATSEESPQREETDSAKLFAISEAAEIYDQNAQSVVNAPPHIVCGFF